jgi:hypothetical protein
MQLSPESERRWAAYLAAERDRVRAVTMPALDAFLDALLAEPPSVWKGWAKNLARETADEGAAWPVRFPLFRRAILPALVEAIAAREPGPARWLASFDQLLFHVPGELPEGLRTSEALLREALRVDPKDQRARQKLVEHVASYLDYTLHELPAGVLWGQNGATAEQCVELQELLTDFREHTDRLQETTRYADLIKDCELHFRTYREYLLAGRPGGSYEAYLREHPAGA